MPTVRDLAARVGDACKAIGYSDCYYLEQDINALVSFHKDSRWKIRRNSLEEYLACPPQKEQERVFFATKALLKKLRKPNTPLYFIRPWIIEEGGTP